MQTSSRQQRILELRALGASGPICPTFFERKSFTGANGATGAVSGIQGLKTEARETLRCGCREVRKV